MDHCLICGSGLNNPSTSSDFGKIDCPRCGIYWPGTHFDVAARRLGQILGGWDPRALHLRSRLSHIVRRQQPESGDGVLLSLDRVDESRLEDPLPSPAEQADGLILWVGDHQKSPAEFLPVPLDLVSAWIGVPVAPATRYAGFDWLLAQQEIASIIEQGSSHSRLPTPPQCLLRLTMQGWARYEALKHAVVASRTALMAMKFEEEELNRVVNECFKPAAERAGFMLRPLNDGQSAGSIDDQLRVALRTSRFVIADLTHGNNGAYWEAGFAEGLGRPVIYTCRKAEWIKQRTHFDTNHLMTIIWELQALEKAGRQLTATIRATLPDEARMAD